MSILSLASQLVLVGRPLALSIILDELEYEKDFELIKTITYAINFIRASGTVAQVIIKGDKKLTAKKDALTSFIQQHVDALQINGEKITVTIEDIVGTNMKLTFTREDE